MLNPFLFSFLIIFIIVFIIKNSIRIINPKDQYFVKFFPKLIFMEKENVKEINLNEFNYLENKLRVDIVLFRALIIKI